MSMRRGEYITVEVDLIVGHYNVITPHSFINHSLSLSTHNSQLEWISIFPIFIRFLAAASLHER